MYCRHVCGSKRFGVAAIGDVWGIKCGPVIFSIRLLSTSGVTLGTNTWGCIRKCLMLVSGVMLRSGDGSVACSGAFVLLPVSSAVLCAKISFNLYF